MMKKKNLMNYLRVVVLNVKNKKLRKYFLQKLKKIQLSKLKLRKLKK